MLESFLCDSFNAEFVFFLIMVMAMSPLKEFHKKSRTCNADSPLRYALGPVRSKGQALNIKENKSNKIKKRKTKEETIATKLKSIINNSEL